MIQLMHWMDDSRLDLDNATKQRKDIVDRGQWVNKM